MPGENENEFSILLANLRKIRSKQRKWGMDWTQKGVAKRLGVSRATYNYWENGKADPSRYDLKNIVSDFGLDDKEAAALYRAAEQAPPIQEIQEPSIIDNLPIQPNPDIQGREEHADALYTAAEQEPSIIDNLPFMQNPFFTGRETELKLLRKQLQETGSAAITQPISITGLGGIGKTELALEYAHSSYQKLYRAALWVNAANESTLQASYEKLAETLKLPERNEQKLERRIQAVKDWLKTHTNWLLIMDNADDLPLAESFLPAKPLGHVIFTTRSQDIDNIAANQIDIDKMELEDGLDLLLRRSRKLQVDSDTRKEALEVVELLGGHPLALDQAGVYIQGTGISFTDYVARYRTERRCLLNKRRSLKSKDSEHSRHPLPVAATLELSIKEAGMEHPLATVILDFCAFLQPDAIPEELFQSYDNFKYGSTEFDDAIAALHSYSLIKRNTQDKIFSIHRLVQAVLIDIMSPELQKLWRKRVALALNAAFPGGRYLWHLSQCERLLSHALVCAMWPEDELTPTVEVAKLFHKTGNYLHLRLRFSEAETLLERTLSIYEQYFGVEHLCTAPVLLDLADLYHNQDKDSQAEHVYLRALAIREKLLGADHPDTVFARRGMTTFAPQQIKYEQIDLWYQRALSILDKPLDLWYQQALDIYEPLKAVPPLPHLDILGLASFLQKRGMHEQAETLYQRLLSIMEPRLEATEPYLDMLKGAYVRFLYSVGRDAEAEGLTVSRTGAAAIDQWVAQQSHIQHRGMFQPMIEKAVAKEMGTYSGRIAEAAALELYDEPSE
jgi:transcriptional regulator with XRE-family HTH domain